MKRISVIIFFISVFAIGSFLCAKYYIPSCEPDGNVMGSKWKDWIVLPGEAIEHSEEYLFFNNVSFKERFRGEYSVVIKVPNSYDEADKKKYWQICYGSWEDPYKLSACVNIPVFDNETEYYLTAQSLESTAWACGFIYAILYQSSDGKPFNGENSIVEGSQCLTKESMGELSPTIWYHAEGLNIPYLFLTACRITPENDDTNYSPGGSVPEPLKFITVTLMSMSEVVIPYVRIVISYKFPDIDSIQTLETEIVNLSNKHTVKSAEVGPFLWIKPTTNLRYRYGEFTSKLIPYWKNPVGTEYEVIHPFPFYINGSDAAMIHDKLGTFYSTEDDGN